ncbi:MAG: cytochrome c [Candidatus Sulfotelmatobacter sp.]
MKAFRVYCAMLSAFLLPALAQTSENGLSANPVFQTNCAKCHGKTAEGRHFAGPSLRSEKTTAASEEDLRIMISNGKGRMPKFGAKLSPADIDRLVAQIKAADRK